MKSSVPYLYPTGGPLINGPLINGMPLQEPCEVEFRLRESGRPVVWSSRHSQPNTLTVRSHIGLHKVQYIFLHCYSNKANVTYTVFFIPVCPFLLCFVKSWSYPLGFIQYNCYYLNIFCFFIQAGSKT